MLRLAMLPSILASCFLAVSHLGFKTTELEVIVSVSIM